MIFSYPVTVVTWYLGIGEEQNCRHWDPESSWRTLRQTIRWHQNCDALDADADAICSGNPKVTQGVTR